MSAYVDPLMNHGWRLGPSCHLFADTIEELRAMAHLVGMKTKWEQPPKQGRPWAHYDLVASRRAEAVKYGAIELDLKQAVAKWREMSNASPREVSRDMASESVKRDANDGGWAFACAAENGHQPGMTLRQWYAGMALQGMYSSGEIGRASCRERVLPTV